jgi:NAD(P)-dependent dehydrogenase (short-subunit alcohol dehydrogenase family)
MGPPSIFRAKRPGAGPSSVSSLSSTTSRSKGRPSRSGEPAEVGRLAAFLLSPAASYLTGVIVPIDGGMIRSLP